MPSEPERAFRLCIFGDSHTAAIRQALRAGYALPQGLDLQFWANVGHRFRFLHWANDRIEPTDDFTARRFAKFNAEGRRALAADDYDAILFAGCRLTTTRLFTDLLAPRMRGEFLSTGLRRAMIARHCMAELTFGFARNLAAQRQAQILFAPVSFDTAPLARAGDPAAETAGAAERAEIWALMAEVFAGEGITLLPQDDRTVTRGCLTDIAYGVEGAVERKDGTHKNAAFGALVLDAALAHLGLTAQAG